MRVRSLRLKNFRRHADTSLEIPDGVTALIGANGSGKSSLLEGIAFALFGTDGLRTGKALVRRDGAPPGDAVEATLEVELGGQALTIHRELRGKALTPSASLVVDGAVVVPNGAGSSEAVTQQVTKRLGMGPDAFFTTVVARQGELARLANESPADRKRMVLRMVGVDRIDTAIELARERRRTGQATLDALRRVAQDPAVAEARVVQARAAVAAADQAFAHATAAWVQAQHALEAAATGVTSLEAAAAQRSALVLDVEAARRDALLRQDAVARADADLRLAMAAHEAAEALAPAAARLPSLQTQWQDAQRALTLARQRAVQEQLLARLESDLAAARKVEAAIAPPPSEVGLDIAEVDVEAAQSEVAAARARLATARGTLVLAQERRRRITSLGEEAPCPTCERPLGGHLHQIAAHTHDAATRADDEVAAALAAEGQAAQRIAEARLRRERAMDAQRRRERHAQETTVALARVQDLVARIAEARAHLPPAALAPAGMDQLRQDLAAAQRAHDDRQRQAGLAERLPALQIAAQHASTAREAALQSLSAREAALAAVPDVSADLARARRDAVQAQAAERSTERTVHEAQRAQATAGQGLQHAEAALAEQRRIAGEVSAAQAEAREWTALTDGHGGLLERFRDHVVDRIGPAIQAEASRLLAAFTGGRYAELLLDTSYNVYVTDAGVPYTLDRFSGGEQDLAHLALRLAVSRLLAERAGGAELRFLALDEVFGSLDAQRRDLVVGALRGLGGLYSQVLVVSHQEALQEALDQAVLIGEGTVVACAT
ncbi:MAG: SMC family ATPase [Candidatus Thermoplasmatota archaeon]